MCRVRSREFPPTAPLEGRRRDLSPDEDSGSNVGSLGPHAQWGQGSLMDDNEKLCLNRSSIGFHCSLDLGHSTPVHIALFGHGRDPGRDLTFNVTNITANVAEVWSVEKTEEGLD